MVPHASIEPLMDKFEKHVSTGVLTFSHGLLDAFFDIEDEVMYAAD